MNQSKLFILILLLPLFMVSCSKILLIPMTLIIMAFFIKKKQYNLALIVLSVLFFASMVFNNNIEFFQLKVHKPHNLHNQPKQLQKTPPKQQQKTLPKQLHKHRKQRTSTESNYTSTKSNYTSTESNYTSTLTNTRINYNIKCR